MDRWPPPPAESAIICLSLCLIVKEDFIEDLLVHKPILLGELFILLLNESVFPALMFSGLFFAVLLYIVLLSTE